MRLTELAAELADKPAIVMGGSGAVLTYRELEDQSNRIAQAFRERGLRPGDHIALLFDNTIDVFPIVWAAQRSGLLYTPVNWHLSDAEAIYIVQNCEARLLLFAPALADLAAAVGRALPELERIVTGDVPGCRVSRGSWRAGPSSRSRTRSRATTCSIPPGRPADPRGSSRRSPGSRSVPGCRSIIGWPPLSVSAGKRSTGRTAESSRSDRLQE
ncbi:AMP-binding protein [Nocardia sp. NBC_00565]|uniref:AMP-binding protein n=1 Tax=Nocardia sp. NBC_00565 TaxID=2975993 RepID=UPI002E821884|nr:AMP-binding protein [Nocardia sp. NBC_00565]WUC05804.1 AMP-binding protein [Nocardia sp. NBC_00565]